MLVASLLFPVEWNLFSKLQSCWSTVFECIHLGLGICEQGVWFTAVNNKNVMRRQPHKRWKGGHRKWIPATFLQCSVFVHAPVYPTAPFWSGKEVPFLWIFKLHDYDTRSPSTRTAFFPASLFMSLSCLEPHFAPLWNRDNTNSIHPIRWSFWLGEKTH